MYTTVKLHKDEQNLLNAMDKYIDSLKAAPQEKAEKDASEALKRTGVTTAKGKTKSKIVSWG